MCMCGTIYAQTINKQDILLLLYTHVDRAIYVARTDVQLTYQLGVLPAVNI